MVGNFIDNPFSLVSNNFTYQEDINLDMVINMVINKVINIIDNNFDLVENSYFKNLITFNIMVKLNMDYYIHMD